MANIIKLKRGLSSAINGLTLQDGEIAIESKATTTYTQTGWYTEVSGGTKRGNAGAAYTPSTEETLYAQFTSTDGSYENITLPAAARDGYTFQGWATDVSATSGVKGEYTPSSNETLYAIWKQNTATGGGQEIYIKIDGQWKLVSQMLTKVNGIWTG